MDHRGDRRRNGRPDAHLLRRFRGVEAVPRAHAIERAAGQRPALKNPVLRLIVIVGRLVLLDDFLERDHVRFLVFDQELDARLVNRRRRERVDEHDEHDEHEGGSGRPASAVHDLHVVGEVHLLERVFGRRRLATHRTNRTPRPGREVLLLVVEIAGIELRLVCHYRNLSETIIVSPGWIVSPSVTLMSFF